METIETLIPDNKGNHLVVVLYFYDELDKGGTFQIPTEFSNLDIADINIRKLDMDRPIGVGSFYNMCHWLIEQFKSFLMLYSRSSVPKIIWNCVITILSRWSIGGACLNNCMCAINQS